MQDDEHGEEPAPKRTSSLSPAERSHALAAITALEEKKAHVPNAYDAEMQDDDGVSLFLFYGDARS